MLGCLGPVDAGPIQHAGGRTHRCFDVHLHSLLWGFRKPSRDSRPRGRLLLFRPGDVSTGIRPIIGRPSLFPHSSTRMPEGLPCGWLAKLAGIRGCRVPRKQHTDGVGGIYPLAGNIVSARPGQRDRVLPAHHFGPSRLDSCSNFGLFFPNGVYRHFTLCSPCHPSPRPSPPVAGSFGLPSRVGPTVSCGYFSGSSIRKNYSSRMCRWAFPTERKVSYS